MTILAPTPPPITAAGGSLGLPYGCRPQPAIPTSPELLEPNTTFINAEYLIFTPRIVRLQVRVEGSSEKRELVASSRISRSSEVEQELQDASDLKPDLGVDNSQARDEPVF